MTLLSTKLFGGGGLPHGYNIIVDAAGGGDYTSIEAALVASVEGDKIFVKNGVYNEGSGIQDLKYGVQLIGESKDGVIYNTTATNGIRICEGHFDAAPQVTWRLSNNTDFYTADGIGLASGNPMSTDVTFNGPTFLSFYFPQPSRSSFVMFDAFNVYDVIGGATHNLILDRPYRSNGNVAKPAILVRRNAPIGSHLETGIRNMTISSNLSRCIFIDDAYNVFVENVDIIYSGNGGGEVNGAIVITNSVKVRIKDVNILVTSTTSGVTGLGCTYSWGVDCSNITILGAYSNYIRGTYSQPLCYCRFDIRSIGNGVYAIQNQSSIYASILHIHEAKDIQQIMNSSVSSNNHWADCDIYIGNLTRCAGGYIVGQGTTVDIKNAELTGTLYVRQNVLYNPPIVLRGLLDGTISVSGGTVVQAIYQTILGTPKANIGYEY